MRAIVAAVLAAVVLAGAATASGGSAPPTTTTPRRDTTAAPTTTLPRPPQPASQENDPARGVVPTIVAMPRVLDRDQQQQRIRDLLATPRRHIAARNAGTICAVVPIARPLHARAWWERNGETVRELDQRVRRRPGFGNCLTPEQGDQVEPGTYQFVVAGPTGATSAAPSIVIGTDRVWLVVRNNGDNPVCMLYMSPREADRYEAYRIQPPLAPGGVARVAVARTEQEIEVYGCPSSGGLAEAPLETSLSLTPRHNRPTNLFG